MQSFALNKYKRELDGQWQGIRLASDGNVYFASSSHSAHHGASFFKYDTTTGQVTELVHEITDICGEDVQTNPQGKIHSDIVEANGWLYMATHFAAEKPGAYETWTGAHALGYELATGKWRDYGVILPGYTSYSAIGVDPARHYLYVFLTGQTAGQAAYMYRINTVTGDKTNLGQVSAPSDGGYDYLVLLDVRRPTRRRLVLGQEPGWRPAADSRRYRRHRGLPQRAARAGSLGLQRAGDPVRPGEPLHRLDAAARRRPSHAHDVRQRRHAVRVRLDPAHRIGVSEHQAHRQHRPRPGSATENRVFYNQRANRARGVPGARRTST